MAAAVTASGVVVVDCGSSAFKAGICGAAMGTTTSTEPQVIAAQPGGLLSTDYWRKVLALASRGGDHDPRGGGGSGVGTAIANSNVLEDAAITRPVIIAVPPALQRNTRARLVELVFEQFRPPALFLGTTAFHSVLGAGLSTALVIDVGEASATATTVEEGYPTSRGAVCAGPGGYAPGGAFLTNLMAGMMQDAACELPPGVSYAEAGRAAKEQLGCVAADREAASAALASTSPSSRCTLPGGGSFSAERGEGIFCGEALFVPPRGSLPPSLHGGVGAAAASCAGPTVGLHDLVIGALRALSDVHLRGRVLDGLLLVGGSSLLPGLPERLLAEVTLQSPWVAPGKLAKDIRLLASPDRATMAWRGGATLAQCDVLQQLWTTRAEYEDGGADVVSRRCV
eukprot:TRINITY_DN52222_c0_g1_i1.p1 TRINITY_DN52222_c0_g1~~TRINITY_DN52222_c0_g1_i1.p1  ORF type:complete len:398 (-),score=91.72 TRINITY_DN52222_c0_g1_i1:45-1238(-)